MPDFFSLVHTTVSSTIYIIPKFADSLIQYLIKYVAYEHTAFYFLEFMGCFSGILKNNSLTTMLLGILSFAPLDLGQATLGILLFLISNLLF